MVALRGNRLGVEVREESQSFSLSSIFSGMSPMLGSDRFVEIYLRTRSGNIYRLDEFGVLINANESRGKGYTRATRLLTRELEKRVLTVGEPFTYGNGAITTEIQEIVAATDKYYDPDYLGKLTKGKTNNIVDDFGKGMPSDLNEFSRIPY